MTIRDRIALQFSLIVACILLVFSLNTYVRSEQYRQREFYNRLEQRARTTVRFLTEVKELDQNLLRVIDRNTLITLYEQKVLVFDARNRLLYASIDDDSLAVPAWLLTDIRRKGIVKLKLADQQVFGLYAPEGKQALTVVASARDRSGEADMLDLRRTLSWSLLIGIGLTVGLGILFAGQSLRPISRINQEVSSINAGNLQKRLDEGNRQDEVAQLAINFNRVLGRLQQAFEQQRTFISHASHELRSPLTALKSELQLGLRHELSVPQYRAILGQLTADTDRIVNLTNSLLLLARALDAPLQLLREPVLIDDVVFSALDELCSAHPHYRVDVNLMNLSQADDYPQVLGDEALLRRMVLNLLDNACKYSENHRAEVQIDTDSLNCRIRVADEGIGISPDQLIHIFDPFYRADNARSHDGFGLGLSICRRIAELHQGRIDVVSEPGRGSTFTISLPHSRRGRF
ncbi:sensor histidine kinase [Fibrivirga algicola]|uniref:histidine kinase n=1 Tax=Fibrivirga algicola TaxID=2950420 RepID=A0ABX0QEA3_9BACT|nr:HAMP domain-containing sensor histidine kinase [Fibrivirga algicola]NID09178.1 HAMP domain-containing histidine kinase [Fibrivirga algicola]